MSRSRKSEVLLAAHVDYPITFISRFVASTSRCTPSRARNNNNELLNSLENPVFCDDERHVTHDLLR